MVRKKKSGSAGGRPGKAYFRFAALGSRKKTLKPRDSGEDVHALQSFLSQMGYLDRDRAPGRMCASTCDALRHFQKCYGIEDTGEGDPETLGLIQRPRCGVPDLVPDAARTTSGPAPFVLRGCKYDTTDLTYVFMNGTPDLGEDTERAIVREAFAAWSAVTPLRFTEVQSAADADFPIAWERRDHGDGSPFDEGGSITGNTLAHAFFPPPCGGPFSGALHFDEFETWTDGAAPGRIRLLNVAIHEIGHLLGLSHSNNRDAIMFAFYDDDVDSLRQDDIDGIQTLYGRRAIGPAPIRGTLTGTGDSQLHRVRVEPGLVTVELQGPPGRDFDLYLRAGLAPTRSAFDARGFSALPNETVRLTTSGGELFILVDSWRGGGDYEVTLALG